MTSDKDTSKKPGSSAGSESNKSSGPGKDTSATAKPTPAAAGGGKKRPVTIDLKPEKVEAKSAETKPEGAVKTTPSIGKGDEKKPDANTSQGEKSDKTLNPAASGKSPEKDAAKDVVKKDEAKADPKAASAETSAATSSTTKPTDAKSGPMTGSPSSSSTSSSSSFSGKPEPASAKSGVGVGGLLAAAVVGGCVSLGGAYLLLNNGLLPLQPASQQATAEDAGDGSSATEALIADLQSKVSEISQTVSDSNPSDLIAGLNDRLAELEKTAGDAVQQAGEDFGPAIEDLKASLETLKTEVAERGAVVVDDAGNAIDTAIIDPLKEQIESLSKAVEDLKGQSSGDAGAADALKVDIKALSDELAAAQGKLDEVSGQLSTQLSQVNDRLQNAETTAKAAQTAVSTSDTSLKTLADSQARAAETLSALSADIQSVGNASKAAQESLRGELAVLSDRLAAVEATMGDATARELAARALSVSALKSAVDSGRPYETELAAVKAGLSADTDLAALEAHAKSGVVPTSVLIAEFPAVARQIHDTFGKAKPEEDVLDSLWSSARSIVNVRGPGDADGSGPDAALRRMENAVANGSLAAAIDAFGELPESAQTVAAGWAERAKARVQIDALTEKASQDVLAGLARKDS